MTSKRGQDLWVVWSGIQKIANLAIRQEWASVSQKVNQSSLKNLPKHVKIEPLSTTDTQLMAKRTSLVMENSLVMSQAMAAASIQYSLKDFASIPNQTPVQERVRKILKRKTAADITDDHIDVDDIEEQSHIYEPNPSMTALDLLEQLPDLTDRRKILSAMFVKKKKPKPKPVIDSEVNHEDETNIVKKARPLAIAEIDTTKERTEQLKTSGAKALAVPSTRLGRMATFASLGAGLGVGTLAEASRRYMGRSKAKDGSSKLDKSVVLTEANAERIVDTLCRVRGAALKIGQMLSIQDQSLINPQVSKIFERVRQAADYMPTWQLHRVMIEEFGTGWREKFSSFDEQPFAAASIGQVHRGVLTDGRVVAVKVQYPGVAKGITSDINNLMGVLKIANILPESKKF